MDQALLSCSALEVGYAGKALLPPVNLEIRPGELWAVVGRNGSGKSTWFRTALGLLTPVRGKVNRASGVRLAYLPQRLAFDPLYPISSAGVVAMGRFRGLSWLAPSFRAHDGVAAALEEVGASHLADRSFRSLSEGQKQRVLLARMLASGAQLAFLDEPTAAMDAVAEREAMELIDTLRREHHLAIVVVSHFLGVARELADRVLFLDPDGRRTLVGSPAEVFASEAFGARYGGMR